MGDGNMKETSYTKRMVGVETPLQAGLKGVQELLKEATKIRTEKGFTRDYFIKMGEATLISSVLIPTLGVPPEILCRSVMALESALGIDQPKTTQ